MSNMQPAETIVPGPTSPRRPFRGAALVFTTVLSLMLAACGSTIAAGPTATPQPKATATPAVLFQADWSHGLSGWNATPGWSIVNGALQSDTGDPRSLTLPYQPTGPNYAVEFTLQIVDIPRSAGYFSLDGEPTSSLSGYRAGVFNLLVPGITYPNSVHPTITTTINPADAQDPASLTSSVHDFEPGDSAHDYRVVVEGSSALLYVDGRRTTSSSSIQSAHLSTGPLRFSCQWVEIRITSMRIMSL